MSLSVIIFQPGQASETLIDPGVNISETTYNVDPEVRFPIPNERELRRKRGHSEVTATRKILSHGDGSQPRAATNMPYQLPGLRWQGSDAITQRQLQSEVQQRIGRQKKKTKTS